ncbi:hypothetical protein Lnau_0798 [Legionella nautarum]|uniref:Uncharacterized protein n=1 Tax=Legionella nautarum TaxID=45070 RepID=A0A0W0WUJ6_9GAMM|nr:hypothetical protein [Legionella nautarum]KTD35814.1 hypothetical protein Lnau_0798 [Legionella nautarum]
MQLNNQIMAYLTIEEEERFASWLNDTTNPATQLLAEFKDVSEIRSLQDLERLTVQVQVFFDYIRNIIYKNLNQSPELPQAVELQEHKVTAEEIILFTAFCLVQSGISRRYYQKMMHYCQYVVSQGSKKYNNKIHLESVLTYLDEQNCVVDDVVADESDFALNEKLCFLQELFTPADAALEYLRDEIPPYVSEIVLPEFEIFLLLLKREVSHAERESFAQEDLQQKINFKMGQLPSLLEQLIIHNLGPNISIHSANQRKRYIEQFKDETLNTYSQMPEEVKASFYNFIGQMHGAVDACLQQFSIKKFANNLLEPLDRFPENKSEQLSSFKALFLGEAERLFRLGYTAAKIGNDLEKIVVKITQHAKSCLDEDDPLAKKEKLDFFDHIINNAIQILKTRAILDPFESALQMQGLELSLTLKTKLTHVYESLSEEIEAHLAESEPEVLRQRYGVCIAELAVLTQKMGNPTLPRERKLDTINSLKNHIETQHSIFSAKMVYTLRSLIGVALTSCLLDKLEAAVGFFSSQFCNNIDQTMKSVVNECSTELSLS